MPLFPPVVECRVRSFENIHSKAVDAVVLDCSYMVADPVAINLIDFAATIVTVVALCVLFDLGASVEHPSSSNERTTSRRKWFMV